MFVTNRTLQHLQQLADHVVDAVTHDVDRTVAHVRRSGNDAVFGINAHVRGLQMESSAIHYTTGHIGRTHLVCSLAGISERVFLGHLLLTQSDLHSREETSNDDRCDAASANWLLGIMKGLQHGGDSRIHIHVSSDDSII